MADDPSYPRSQIDNDDDDDDEIPEEFWEELPTEALESVREASSRTSLSSDLFQESRTNTSNETPSSQKNKTTHWRDTKDDDDDEEDDDEDDDDNDQDDDDEDKQAAEEADTTIKHVQDVVKNYDDNTEVLTSILEESLLQGLCNAYRCLYLLREYFEDNDIVDDLFHRMNEYLAPVFRHVYRHANTVYPNGRGFMEVLYRNFCYMVNTTGDRKWISFLRMEEVDPLPPPDTTDKCFHTVFTQDQRDELCQMCTSKYSQFVKSFENEVVYANFTPRFVDSRLYGQFFTSSKTKERLRLDVMIPALAKKKPYEYQNIKCAYDWFLSYFAFMRLIYTGTKEKAYRHLLSVLFDKLGNEKNAKGQSALGKGMIKQVMKIAEGDEKLQQLTQNMNPKQHKEFNDQLQFLFNHFSNSGVMGNMMNTGAMKELQQWQKSMSV
jgi:hypothetical protein